MTSMAKFMSALMMCAAMGWAPAQRPDDVIDTSPHGIGERMLRQEVIVPGALNEVWEAFTTSEGLRSFAVPVVEFELKSGGKFHTHYQPGAKIGDPGTIFNTVVAYLPLKMLAFRVGLTDRFPAGPREAGTLFTVIEFESTAPRATRVVGSMLGWGRGEDWDEVYRFFASGNAYTLRKLQARFLKGPVQ